MIREQIGRMEDKEFSIQWIPSLVGIYGNDEADDFANRAVNLVQLSHMKITYFDALCDVRKRMLDTWLTNYQHYSLLTGRQHFDVQSTVQTKSCFHGTNLNGKEIKKFINRQ